MSEHTQGAFDVTVGPLTRLWRRARRKRQLPTQAQLEAARAAVGFSAMELDAASQAVRLTKPAMRLDLGGIAKGYALDEALATLRRAGFPRALINGGGDLRLGAPPPSQTGWKIGVASLEPDQPVLERVELSECAVATSGDAYQYVEIDGVRYSHIVDPRTGLGVTQRKAATVIAHDGMTADAYASALCVLEAEDGLRIINDMPHVEAMILWTDGEEVYRVSTPGFPVARQDATGACTKEK